MKSMALVLASAALWASAASASPAAPSYDSYRSWFVACDNTLSCEARGFDKRHPGEAALHITHEAGPDASLGVTLYAALRYRLGELTVDGVPLGLPPDDWTVNSAADHTTVIARRPDAARALIARLRNGKQIGFRGSKMVITLDGMAAALARMDERQGRIGSVTALIRSGPAPEEQVVPAPPLRVVVTRRVSATLTHDEALRLIASTRAAGRALLAEQKCTAAAAGPPEPAAYPLDARRALVFLPCGTGSYGPASLALIVPRDGKDPIALFRPDLPAGTATSTPTGSAMIVGADFNPQKGVLTMLDPRRDGSYCGASARWGWDGRSFHLAEVESQRECGGFAPLDWPLLYRSREQPDE